MPLTFPVFRLLTLLLRCACILAPGDAVLQERGAVAGLPGRLARLCGICVISWLAACAAPTLRRNKIGPRWGRAACVTLVLCLAIPSAALHAGTPLSGTPGPDAVAADATIPALAQGGGSSAVLQGSVALVWFSVAAPDVRGAVPGLWDGAAADGPLLAGLPAPGAVPDGSGGGGAGSEDHRARLGAAFLAAVLGPRPRRPAALSRGAAGLRDLIAMVEAGGAGYDAVVYGATVPPPARPSQMTLGQIRAWVQQTPRQNHAIGRYQIVPATFDSLVARLNLPPGTRYAPAVQDRMADLLIADAGYHEFLSGSLTRRAFMENLATIWAGLPRADGRSAWHGVNGNRAGMSWRTYSDLMARIFPP